METKYRTIQTNRRYFTLQCMNLFGAEECIAVLYCVFYQSILYCFTKKYVDFNNKRNCVCEFPVSFAAYGTLQHPDILCSKPTMQYLNDMHIIRILRVICTTSCIYVEIKVNEYLFTIFVYSYLSLVHINFFFSYGLQQYIPTSGCHAASLACKLIAVRDFC